MRLKSTYQFYRVHFGYSAAKPAQAKAYGMAIQDFQEVLADAYLQQSWQPITEYLSKAYTKELTKTFLGHLQALALRSYQDPFAALRYIENHVIIDQKLLSSKRRGLIIPVRCLYGASTRELIFIVFGPPANITPEMSVLLGLVRHFRVVFPLPKNVATYTYWDVANGGVASVSAAQIRPIGRSALLRTCNRF